MQMNHSSHKLFILACLVYGHLLLPAQAVPLATVLPTNDLIDLDIESLMDIEVYSASKKTQRLKDVSSAVFVINQEMIHNSGLTEIPELLRLAPGVQVSRINGNSWSVSIRGGSGRYGDKLLVMIDGRSIYTLLFAGVYWENQDIVLNDIDRIEVIRGPGATIWGANAVNGVINIITKNASETQGSHVAVSSGTINNAITGFRYGGLINDDAAYRISLKYRDQKRLHHPVGTDNYDGSTIGNGSFRSDWTPTTNDTFNLQGGFYKGTIEEHTNDAIPAPPYINRVQTNDNSRGWNMVGSWQHYLSDTNQVNIKLYYDNVYRDAFFYTSDMDTWDLALQQQLAIGKLQDLTYGFRYRYTESDLQANRNLNLRQNNRNDYLYSFFIQDEISLLTDTLSLTLGSKFEEQSLSKFEILPTARILWKATEKNSFWASVSRAVRSPSIGEQDITIDVAYYPLNGAPNQLASFSLIGNPELDSERSIAYEAGYRSSISNNASLDLTLFYTTDDNIRGFAQLAPTPVLEPVPHLRTGLQIVDNISSHSYGFELSADWKAMENVTLHVNYAYLQIVIDNTSEPSSNPYSEFEGRTPDSLYSLTTNWKPHEDVDLGLSLYGSSRLDYSNDPIPAFLRCDLRAAWRPTKGVELSMVAQNLFDPNHSEFPTTESVHNSDIPRSILASLTLDF